MENGSFIYIFLYFSCYLLQRLVKHKKKVTFGRQINVDFIFSILSDSSSFFNPQKLLRGFAAIDY
jgi:hypothetical protein